MNRFGSDSARRRVFPGLSAIVLSGTFALPAAADDAALKARVEARFAKARLEQQGEIAVAAADGAVRLDGAVLTLEARRKAETLARKDSRRIENHLRVLPEPRLESDVRKDAEEAILRYPYYGVFDSVEMAVTDGVVVLRGSVLQPYRKQEIEDRVARVAGVTQIHNEVRVQSVSSFDERLRRELYRAIYGDERFIQYANRVHPPIRIVVDRGRVTLTGYVGSRVEQTLVGHIARGVSSFGVDNRVEVEGQPPRQDRRTDS